MTNGTNNKWNNNHYGSLRCNAVYSIRIKFIGVWEWITHSHKADLHLICWLVRWSVFSNRNHQLCGLSLCTII